MYARLSHPTVLRPLDHPPDELHELDQLDPLDRRSPDTIPCREHGPELWFAESPLDLEHAKQLCHECPVRAGCLAGALERREPCGVWGGEIFDRGAILPRKRPRGRPRKVDREPIVA